MVPRDLLIKSTQNQRKVEHSDPFTIFRVLSLRKEGSELCVDIQAFALTRMGGACAWDLTLVSSPSPSEIERTDRELLGSQAKNEVKVEEKQKRGKPKADRNTQGVSPHRTKVRDQWFP